MILILRAFQIVAGWWGHQPGRLSVGGVPTAHKQQGKATIWNAIMILICNILPKKASNMYRNYFFNSDTKKFEINQELFIF